TLAESGVGPAGITVGYGADEVRELVGMRAEYIQSSRWASTNSLYSFWLARDWVKGDVMVLNCDVLFSRQIIERLLDAPGDAIAVDRSSGSGREQMKVECAGDRLVAMSKNMTAAERAGENVGILKLTKDTAHRLFQRRRTSGSRA
ncbi:MAG: phosphocholine cytidylyltransferase family protein, partial [Acidobacteria bacterium]|nr:phosphocholine cytidylyltransferase family protein [Acidobacteriota bacterium]